MKLNNIWGYGQLFGFSGLDGANRYYKDFTQSETARILGMSQVTVSRYEKKSLTKMYNYLSI